MSTRINNFKVFGYMMFGGGIRLYSSYSNWKCMVGVLLLCIGSLSLSTEEVPTTPIPIKKNTMSPNIYG